MRFPFEELCGMHSPKTQPPVKRQVLLIFYQICKVFNFSSLTIAKLQTIKI